MPALQALCDERDVGAVVPLTDLDIEVLAQARADGLLPALVPDPEVAARDLRQVRDAPAARAPRPAVAADRAAGEPSRESYPVMVKPRQGSGARSIHPAPDRAEAAFFVGYVDEPVMVQKLMDGPGVLDGLPRPTSTAAA